MSVEACDRIRARVAETAGPDVAGVSDDVARHLDACADCRSWCDAYFAALRAWEADPDPSLGAGVIARTSETDALLADLPSLAEWDPGPGFTERILRCTSQKPPSGVWHERWLAIVRRPRFAWEAAYVATLCFVLALGNPLRALETGGASQTRITAAVQTIQGRLESLGSTLGVTAGGARADAATAGAAPAAEADGLERLWNAGSSWLMRLVTPVLDAVARALESVAAWLRTAPEPNAPAPAPAPAKTEPDASSVRSPQ
jgi:hypothetical protein